LRGATVLTAAVRLRPDAQISSLRTFMLYDPLSPVSLSPSQITFSHFIPTGHKTNRCIDDFLQFNSFNFLSFKLSTVFLTNLHFQNVVLFSWPDAPIDGGGCIRFQPKCGRICPRVCTLYIASQLFNYTYLLHFVGSCGVSGYCGSRKHGSDSLNHDSMFIRG
jgi:hypothetical protein